MHSYLVEIANLHIATKIWAYQAHIWEEKTNRK